MNKNLLARTQEPIAILAFVLFYAFTFMKSTMLIAWFTPGINRVITYACYALLFCSILLSTRFSWREIIAILALGLIGAVVTATSDSNLMLVYVLAAAALADVDKKRVAWAALMTGLAVTAVTIALSRTGKIENLVYFQQDENLDTRTRQALGFVYPTDFAAHVFYLLLIVFYLTRGQLNVWTGALYLGSAWLVKEICDARLSMATILLVFAASALLTLWKDFQPRRMIRWGLILACPIGAALTFGMELLYAGGSGLGRKLNDVLSSRLSIGCRLLEESGVTLLGQEIEQHGNGQLLDSLTYWGEYSYIDMSFQRILQMYGIIAFVAVILCAVLLTKRELDRGNVLVPVILALVTVNSIVDQHYLDFSSNIFLLMLLDRAPEREKTREAVLHRLRRLRGSRRMGEPESGSGRIT